jgi:hypothetical protein
MARYRSRLAGKSKRGPLVWRIGFGALLKDRAGTSRVRAARRARAGRALAARSRMPETPFGRERAADARIRLQWQRAVLLTSLKLRLREIRHAGTFGCMPRRSRCYRLPAALGVAEAPADLRDDEGFGERVDGDVGSIAHKYLFAPTGFG